MLNLSIKNINRKNAIALIILIIMIASIGLTVLVAQKQQETRQQATSSSSATSPKRIRYDKLQTQKDYQRFTNRSPLSRSDLKAKDRILKKLRENRVKSGIVFENSNVSIEYISSVDDFEAQILTVNINLAKTQAQDWLASQGLSNAGICALPLHFYLSAQAKDSLPQGTVFSPSPLICQ